MDNKQLILHHFEEFVNRKNSDIVFTNMTKDFLDHDELNGPQVGPEAAKAMMENMYKMIPDLHVTIEDIIAEADKVVVRNIWSGTMRGEKMQFKGFVLWRIENGKIAERWATVTPPEPLHSKKPGW